MVRFHSCIPILLWSDEVLHSSVHARKLLFIANINRSDQICCPIRELLQNFGRHYTYDESNENNAKHVPIMLFHAQTIEIRSGSNVWRYGDGGGHARDFILLADSNNYVQCVNNWPNNVRRDMAFFHSIWFSITLYGFPSLYMVFHHSIWYLFHPSNNSPTIAK